MGEQARTMRRVGSMRAYASASERDMGYGPSNMLSGKWHGKWIDQNAISQAMAWEQGGSEDRFHHWISFTENLNHITKHIENHVHVFWWHMGVIDRGTFVPRKILIRVMLPM